ncbi:hypothetical protein [Planococcus halocryophilus]|uniref:hypothetical protein n=1 Tax=Planococcus halocryophilus TaxID=1215089 RepID=UPI001F10D4D8|nr:hypothetical protein [Planococcus halocryophilus]MCH4825768.1 hypothetical protein [Planococcus halocryophilus]
MEEHELRRLLTHNVHGAKRELKKLSDEWEKALRRDVKVNQTDVNEFNEVAGKVNDLATKFETAFIKYEEEKEKFKEKQKMKSHEFNIESFTVLKELFQEIKAIDDVSIDYFEANAEYLNTDIDIENVIRKMEEFLEILKK